jgi:head-tail adaptor
MTIDRLLHDTVVLLHPGAGSDDYGNPVPTWALGAASQTVSAVVQQIGRAEQTSDRDTPASDWLLVVPAGTAISAYDRVRWQGATFEVIGKPAPWSTPRGPHHLEARIRLVE